MPEVITTETTVFTYDELDDSAKESAREWYLKGGLDYEWWDSVYDDFARIGEILGLEVDLKKTYFNGFYHQGSGSAYTAEYEYKKGSAKAIRQYAPLDKELHRIADALAAGQRRLFYSAYGEVTTANRESSVSVNLRDQDGEEYEAESYRSYAGAAGEIETALEDLNAWLYSALEREYEWLTGEESVSESIRCNEYTFTESGEFFA